MLLPTKHLMLNESLFGLGVLVIKLLDKPKSIDRIWKDFEKDNIKKGIYISFDNLILILDYLYILGLIDIDNNKIILCN